jgi:hypothetical protein
MNQPILALILPVGGGDGMPVHLPGGGTAQPPGPQHGGGQHQFGGHIHPGSHVTPPSFPPAAGNQPPQGSPPPPVGQNLPGRLQWYTVWIDQVGWSLVGVASGNGTQSPTPPQVPGSAPAPVSTAAQPTSSGG